MKGSPPRIDGWYDRQWVFALVCAFLIVFAVAGCGTTYSDYEIDPAYVSRIHKVGSAICLLLAMNGPDSS